MQSKNKKFGQGFGNEIPKPISGFTLLEVIIVIALIGFIYAVGIPTQNTSTIVANRLAQLNSDIRAAFDMAVLTGKTHRLVFHMVSGNYWLESTESEQVLLGDQKSIHDPSQQEEEEKKSEFNVVFENYVDLAGQTIRDPETDEEIKPESPVLQAKDKLKPAEWYKVKSLEWSDRSLGEELIIKSIQSEHLERSVSFEDIGADARGMIYFLPSGYIEKAVVHIYYRVGETEVDSETEPYTLSTKPYAGVGMIESGFKSYEAIYESF